MCETTVIEAFNQPSSEEIPDSFPALVGCVSLTFVWLKFKNTSLQKLCFQPQNKGAKS